MHPIVNYSDNNGNLLYKQGYWCYYTRLVPAGTNDQTWLTNTLPTACHAIQWTALSAFWMNSEDAAGNPCGYMTGSQVQFRTTRKTTGSGGVLVSGIWLTRSST